MDLKETRRQEKKTRENNQRNEKLYKRKANQPTSPSASSLYLAFNRGHKQASCAKYDLYQQRYSMSAQFDDQRYSKLLIASTTKH